MCPHGQVSFLKCSPPAPDMLHGLSHAARLGVLMTGKACLSWGAPGNPPASLLCIPGSCGCHVREGGQGTQNSPLLQTQNPGSCLQREWRKLAGSGKKQENHMGQRHALLR